MDVPLECADHLEGFASLLAGLQARLATAVGVEEAAARVEAARGDVPARVDRCGVDLDPMWDLLESSGPGAVFPALAGWVQRFLDGLPGPLAERLVVEFAEELDRSLEATARFPGRGGT